MHKIYHTCTIRKKINKHRKITTNKTVAELKTEKNDDK